MNKTIQRQTICEELCKLTSHPTADELYDIVKKRMPQISLGTVYRNLEQLAECGVVLKLETAGRQKRFDGNPAPHHHIRCKVCGAVRDLHHESLKELDECIARLLPELGANRAMIEFEDICPECKIDHHGNK